MATLREPEAQALTQLFTEVGSNFLEAVTFHRGMSDTFTFIRLPGFSRQHEFQFYDESLTSRKLKKFLIETVNIVTVESITPGGTKYTTVFDDYTRNATRIDYANEEVRKRGIEELYDLYQGWETKSLRFYQEVANSLREMGNVVAFNYMQGIVDDVSEELTGIENDILMFKGMSWDLPTITDMQSGLERKYQKKLNNLNL